MYQVSRAMYRELARDIAGGPRQHATVLRACEAAVERLVADSHSCARPSRALYRDLRRHFDMAAWPRVWMVVDGYMSTVRDAVAQMPFTGRDAQGNPLGCRATTRRGTPCQRLPLHRNGYCPSHQHLAETDEVEALAVAA